MPVILLARHAQGSFGAADYDVLSETGREQAGALADELARSGQRVDRVLSGSLARQRDTALAVAERAGVEIETDARWDEYASDDLVARHAPDAPAPANTREFQEVLDVALGAWVSGGDPTWPTFRDAVAGALEDLAGSLRSGECALVSTSGGPIAAAAVALLGLPPTALVPFNRVLVNAGITKLVSGPSGVTLVSFNEHGYLERPGGSLVTYR